MEKYEAEQILELKSSYDAPALKAAYRKLAAQHHPDAVEARGGDKEAATARMQEINEAHDYLAGLLARSSGSMPCETGPQPAGAKSGASAQAGASAYATPFNPFEGRRRAANPHRERQRAGRETTAEHYYWDPRFQANLNNARRRAEQAREDGTWNPAAKVNVVPEDPTRPNPRWYAPVYRFFALFPYRFVFLVAMCLLANLSDPTHTGRTLGPFTFEEFVVFLGLLNLIVPVFTSPLRAVLLGLVNGLRSLHWRLSRRFRGNAAG